MSEETKTYKVTGPSRVLGHEPGSVFEAAIPEAKEKRLIERGSLSHSRAKTSEAEPDTEHEAAQREAQKELDEQKERLKED